MIGMRQELTLEFSNNSPSGVRHATMMFQMSRISLGF